MVRAFFGGARRAPGGFGLAAWELVGAQHSMTLTTRDEGVGVERSAFIYYDAARPSIIICLP